MKPERVVEEIGFLKAKYRIRHVSFMDENFFIDQQRVNKICDLLKDCKLDVSWFANIRVDYLCRNGFIDLLMKAKHAGFSECGIGAESGSDRILAFLKKDIKTEQILNSAKLCNKLDIVPKYSFMIGVPSETKEELLQTIELIRRIRQVCPKSIIIGPQIFRPYPGGELYKACKKLGMKEPVELQDWVTSETYLDGNDKYFSTRILPWVADPDFLYAISLYGNALGIKIGKALEKRKLKEAVFAMGVRLAARLGIHFLTYGNVLWEKIRRLSESSRGDALLRVARIVKGGYNSQKKTIDRHV